MKNLSALFLVLLGAFQCAETHAAETQPTRPVALRCEYLDNPVGLDAPKPGMSWQMKSDTRGQKQSAHQILVGSSRDHLDKGMGDLWDTGKVESDQSNHVVYDGKPLKSLMRCFWKVRIWDKDGNISEWSEPAEWTMGLLNPEDWHAQWISSSQPEEITITKATYQTTDGRIAKDVTAMVRQQLAGGKPLSVTPDRLGGDPALGVVKELVIEYRKKGQPRTVRPRDFETIDLFDRKPPGAFPFQPLEPAPLFRKEFELASVPETAHVTVHTPAYFELYINGAKVGKDVLSPAVFNPQHQSFSLTHDVARLLGAGRNCVGLWLGNGWADHNVVRAQLDAVVNGKSLVIGTDNSWKTTSSGIYRIGGRKWNDFGGERIDARELIPNWSTPGLDTASWSDALAADAELGPVRAQPCPTNRIGKEIPAVKVSALDNGKYEIDFGMALTGWLRLKMPALPAGKLVRMTFADARPGEFKREKGYQHFNQVSEYISGGNSGEVFENKFNYAGFRYVIVEGLATAPQKDDAVALLVESDLEESGAFECSNVLLNRIHQVNRWTQRCLNLGGYYVDCPHRERLGYGDGQVAAEGFMTNFRADGFYRKWLRDWRLRQTPVGNLPHVAPFSEGGGGPGWGGLFPALTWRHYLYYGDKRVLVENYDAVLRYVNYLESISLNGVLRVSGGKWDFIGDWVPPGKGMDTNNWPSPKAAELFNNCYRIKQMELLVKMASALGKSDDAARYRKRLDEIRPLVHAAFYDADQQQYVIDEQAYYVMPLMTGIVPQALREILLKKLEHNILVKNKGHLDTGMLGTYFMMEYLRDIGRNDLVFTMFNQTTYPGWGYMLEQGATTLWEQWNGYWSHIHSCFTSADNWLYQGVAGIQADPDAPGMKNVIIKPAIVGDLTWAKARYDSPYGRIISQWKREVDRITIEVTIPPNSTATVHVPTKSATGFTVNGQPPKNADHVTLMGMEQGCAVVAIGSGSHTFITTR